MKVLHFLPSCLTDNLVRMLSSESHSVESVMIARKVSRDGKLRYERECPDVTDFDLILCDLESVIGWEDRDISSGVGSELRERIEQGGVLIGFVGKLRFFMMGGPELWSNYKWLPLNFLPRDHSGEEMECNPADVLVGPILKDYLGEARWTCDLWLNNDRPAQWTEVVWNKNRMPVAARAVFRKGHVILLPRISIPKADECVYRLIKEVLPRLAPQLKLTPLVSEARPLWLNSYASQIPGVVEIERKVQEAESQIKVLEETKKLELMRKQGLEKWAELLWCTGDTLEERVREALTLLGIPNQKKGLIDTVASIEGKECYIEIEGSIQSIKVDKARQLLHWISEAPDPSTIYGAIIGNPFRQDELRPPPNHKDFVKEVENMAHRYHWCLMTTTELFQFVKRKLSGDASASQEIQLKLFPPNQ